MPIEPIDSFDPLDPNSCPDWDARAERYLTAKIKEMRGKQRVLQGNDLNTMFRDGGDSGECNADGQIEWESEKRELVAKIIAARNHEIGTGL